jgi:HTH-type transcriptional regulator/antitoxin HigA
MKSLKPIRTKASYEAALKEVERLWGARSGTPAGDRLDILATLIEAYEDEHYPMDPPDPIDAIKFRMEQQGLSDDKAQEDGLIGKVSQQGDVDDGHSR